MGIKDRHSEEAAIKFQKGVQKPCFCTPLVEEESFLSFGINSKLDTGLRRYDVKDSFK
jgi:hypothetical protein